MGGKKKDDAKADPTQRDDIDKDFLKDLAEQNGGQLVIR